MNKQNPNNKKEFRINSFLKKGKILKRPKCFLNYDCIKLCTKPKFNIEFPGFCICLFKQK